MGAYEVYIFYIYLYKKCAYFKERALLSLLSL